VPDFTVPASEWERTPGLDNALGDLNRAFNALAQIPGDLNGARVPLAQNIAVAAKKDVVFLVLQDAKWKLTKWIGAEHQANQR
jgi:hypothetical protein